MKYTSIKTISLTMLATLACGTLMAQELQYAVATRSATRVIPYRDAGDSINANVTIFSNLGPTPTTLYTAFQGYYVAGSTNVTLGQSQWVAVPFTTGPAAVHAKTLEAAIGYDVGTKRVKLGIYADAAGVVGAVVPGGEGATTLIPTNGVCCQLTKVTLAGAGVALTASTPYWLVASSDEAAAPDFEGVWQSVVTPLEGGNVAMGGWFTFVPNNQGACRVRGTQP